MSPETFSANVIPIDEAVKSAAITDQHNEASVESGVPNEGSIAIPSEIFGTTDKAIKSAAIPDQQNEKSVQSEVVPEKYS